MSVASTVTIDTGEWLYVDITGITHAVTNGQTFTLTIDDNSASDVRYYLTAGQTPITTTDGYVLVFRPETTQASGTSGSNYRMIAPLTDAGQGSDFYSLRGEICIECPVSHVVQRWSVAKMNPSDADFGSAGTIAFTLEDQFGHQMSVTGVTVGQAA